MPVVEPVESEFRLRVAAVRARLLVCSLQCPWHLQNEHCSVVSRSAPVSASLLLLREPSCCTARTWHVQTVRC